MRNTIGCRGHTIKTASGVYFDFTDPVVEDISLSDISVGLSKICRFGGQLPDDKFYTVAEHSVLCLELAQRDGITDKAILRAILLHDATEAYCGDVVKPLKNLMGDAYTDIEQRIENAIAEKFSVDFKRNHDIIKKYDTEMLFAEKNFLLDCDPNEIWTNELEFRKVEIEINMLPAWAARKLFIDKYIEVTNG